MKWALIGFFMLAASLAHAHKPSDSYLKLSLKDSHEGQSVSGQWDIALRDLDYAIGLDRNQDNQITWGELRAVEDEIAAYAFTRLNLHAGQASCDLIPTDPMVDHHTDGAYAVIFFTGACPNALSMTVDYRLFFDLDPTHRGLLQIEREGRVQTAILSPEQSTQQIMTASVFRQMLDFGRMGLLHILMGYDHILFLLTLLLPSVLLWTDVGMAGVSRFAPAFWNVAKIVTAFTLAHSITLGLAALHVVSLPSRGVESAIAASIFCAAVNNVRPFIRRRIAWVAFGFGLIHGFGFAGFLNDFGLPKEALLQSLFSFNLGVEVGQLGIVALFLPAAFAVRRLWFYQKIVLVGGSASIAVLSTLMLVERAFDLTLLP